MDRFFRKSVLLGGLAAAMAVGTSSAEAALTIDLRVPGQTGSAAKQVQATDALQLIRLEVLGTVTGGTNGVADEGLQSVFGSFVSTLANGGSAIGNFSNFQAAAPFNATVQAGKQQDLNGQPGLDLGSFNDATTVPGDYVQARASAIQIGTTPDTASFLLGTVDFTVQSLPGSGSTLLQFVPRTNATGGNLNTAALFREDGVNKNPTNSTFAAGQPITVTAVPEPASLGVLGLAAVALLGRRRAAR